MTSPDLSALPPDVRRAWAEAAHDAETAPRAPWREILDPWELAPDRWGFTAV